MTNEPFCVLVKYASFSKGRRYQGKRSDFTDRADRRLDDRSVTRLPFNDCNEYTDGAPMLGVLFRAYISMRERTYTRTVENETRKSVVAARIAISRDYYRYTYL